MPETPFPGTFVVRFPAPGGGTAGLGALVHSRHVVTCAHVVNTALGRRQREQDQPDGAVTVEFPLLPGQGGPPLRAQVRVWRPPPTGEASGDDIAGLVLDGDPPDGAVPARLSAEPARPDRGVKVYGYQAERPDGCFVSGVVQNAVSNGRLQIDSDLDSALRVQAGFSGTPVYDGASGQVVGIIVEAPQAAPSRDSYAISADQIRRAWPQVLPGIRERAAARRRDREAAELTILHVSGVRFTGDGQRPELSRLHHDLAGLAVHPDLLVVTGDLADRGRPSEFDQAVRFLNELSEAAGIPRGNVAVVPGNHDINRKACAAYFSMAEAREEDPVAPYWLKWEDYRQAFGEFYDGTPAAGTFTADEPFTLFEMPELNVVVAGLNSTIADSHREADHHGELGKDQLRWFQRTLQEYQGRGWLRVAAVHHGEPADSADLYTELGEQGLAHLLLHDGAPGARRLPSGATPGVLALATGGGRYQLLTVRPDSVTRHVRRYLADENRWEAGTGDGGTDPGERIPHRLIDAQEVFPPGEDRADPLSGYSVSETFLAIGVQRNEFLDRVREATEARFPRATITARPDENYLRVRTVREKHITEQWLIGVIDGLPSTEKIDDFAGGVHAQLAIADPSLRSELVHGGQAAPKDLEKYAQRRGIRLKSLVQYQGLIDLKALVAAQRDDPVANRAYPPALYVQQRYRTVHGAADADEVRTGLVAQAVDWLRAEHARLVVVLGDFGRGKTAFLRQLARVLPDELPAMDPVLVELRRLEKGPTLDDLLSQYLIRQGVEDFTPDKLRYMIDNGLVALLFDGFDELELRVGYDSADEYLRELLSSVSPEGKAKVILTSRTQHFRSTGQVLTALGQKVESRSASRVVVLEEFSDEQMTDFLTRFYDGDEGRARERLARVRDIGNLADLAHNPRMLSFIARLDSDRMSAALDDSDQVNAAQLYRQIIDDWLEDEAERQRHRHGLPAFTKDQRFAACRELALRLWQSGDPHLALADLSRTVMNTLSDLATHGFTTEQAAHAIAAGSLLVRIDDGVFTFIHQSVMEWFVAEAATENPEILSRGEVSTLMADFVGELAGADAASDLARQAIATGSDTARRNAYTLTQEHNRTTERIFTDSDAPGKHLPGLDLSGLDLRGKDLNGRDDLTNANLRNTNLRGMRLTGVDLTGADLSGADLTGVTMIGGSLRDAILTGSQWDRAAILGTAGLPAGSPELAAVAIPGRDPEQVMFVPPGECEDVVFSPDGTLLAVAWGHTVQLIDVGGGTTLRVLHGHTRQVTGVVFSPDGTVLATSSRDGTARLWDVPAGTERRTLTGHDGWVTSVAFSSDGVLVATASRDGTARTWDTASGRTCTTLAGHHASVNAVVFSPDDTLLATASGDGTARTWDVGEGVLRKTFSGHESDVTSVAFSPDGVLLATGSADRTARVWDTGTGTERGTIAEYSGRVTSVAFSPDGRVLGTSHSSRIETLDVVSGVREATFRDHFRRVSGVAFSPDGTLIATVSASAACIWNRESGIQRTVTLRPAAPVTSVAFSAEGSLLAVADRAGAIRAWGTRTGTRRFVVSDARSRAVTSVAFSPVQPLLATAFRDGAVCTWDALTGEQRATEYRSDPVAVAFSPDGTRFGAASLEGALRIWNADSQPNVIAHDFGRASALAFSANGAFLAAATVDGTSVVQEISSWTMVASVETHGGSFDQVSAVAVSCDGGLLALASESGTVCVWDTRTGGPVAVLSGHELAVTSLAFSPGATMIVTGSDDGTARTWDLRTGQDRTVLTGHKDSVRAVTFSADGTLIATGSSDGTARLWEAASGNEIAALISLPGGGFATLLPDGGYKLSEEAEDLWWSVKLRRFVPGELDPYVQGLRRLPLDQPINE